MAAPTGGPLCFNVSHSHGRALFAFARGREVGIDLEAGARLGDDWPGLVRRIFSAREQGELFSLPAEQRRAAFLNGWTRKEAFLKATGQGLVDGLQSIEVTLDPARPPALLAADPARRWTVHDLRRGEDYAAALVVEGRSAGNRGGSSARVRSDALRRKVQEPRIKAQGRERRGQGSSPLKPRNGSHRGLAP